MAPRSQGHRRLRARLRRRFVTVNRTNHVLICPRTSRRNSRTTSLPFCPATRGYKRLRYATRWRSGLAERGMRRLRSRWGELHVIGMRRWRALLQFLVPARLHGVHELPRMSGYRRRWVRRDVLRARSTDVHPDGERRLLAGCDELRVSQRPACQPVESWLPAAQAAGLLRRDRARESRLPVSSD
jgi:hypothetical protein